jgi:hypothetical protein
VMRRVAGVSDAAVSATLADMAIIAPGRHRC